MTQKDKLNLILDGCLLVLANWDGPRSVLGVILPKGFIHRRSPTLAIPSQEVIASDVIDQLPHFLSIFYPQAFDKPVYIYSSWVKYRQKESIAIIKPQPKIPELIIAP